MLGQGKVDKSPTGDRFRLQFKTISAEANSELAFALWYLDCFLDSKDFIKRLIRYSCFLKGLKAWRIKSKAKSHPEVNSLVRTEAIESIWFFWGIIEGICEVSGVPPSLIAERVCAGDSDSNEFKISDFSRLMADVSDEYAASQVQDKPDRSAEEGSTARERMSSIASKFEV